MSSYKATDFLTGNFIKKEDVQAEDVTLTIANVEPVQFTNADTQQVDRRLQVTFNNDKKLTLNATNLQILIKRFGAHTQNWIGQAVTLYFDDNVTYAGRLVGGVRIRVPKVRAQGPTLVPVADEEADPIPF